MAKLTVHEMTKDVIATQMHMVCWAGEILHFNGTAPNPSTVGKRADSMLKPHYVRTEDVTEVPEHTVDDIELARDIYLTWLEKRYGGCWGKNADMEFLEKRI